MPQRSATLRAPALVWRLVGDDERLARRIALCVLRPPGAPPGAAGVRVTATRLQRGREEAAAVAKREAEHH